MVKAGLLVWVVSTLICLNAHAAELVKYKDGPRIDDAQYELTGCNYRFSGQIKRGDLKKVQNIRTVKQTIPLYTIVCLDSPGGSFSEAIKIARYFKQNSISTKVDANATCESACSLIFMAGSVSVWDYGLYHWRILHPKGRLGFHAPSLIIENGQYNEASVKKSYAIALSSISKILNDINLIPVLGDEVSISYSLLAKMLETPGDSMFYIDTIDKAGRWGIILGPTNYDDVISDLNLAKACVNAEYWVTGKSSAGDDFFSNKGQLFVRTNVKGKIINKFVVTNEMHEAGCKFQYNKNARTLSKVTSLGIVSDDRSRDAGFRTWIATFLPPSTPIRFLAK